MAITLTTEFGRILNGELKSKNELDFIKYLPITGVVVLISQLASITIKIKIALAV